MFNALIRNNKHFGQNLHHITFFNSFFEETVSKGVICTVSFVLFIQI